MSEPGAEDYNPRSQSFSVWRPLGLKLSKISSEIAKNSEVVWLRPHYLISEANSSDPNIKKKPLDGRALLLVVRECLTTAPASYVY